MRTTVISSVVLACIIGLVFADSWSFPPKVEQKVYEFGESRIVLEVDARHNHLYPDFILSIYLAGQLTAKYRNVGFDQLCPSPGNEYFVGLSNKGLPGTAFVVFDKHGSLIREQKHQFADSRIYTSVSVTLIREWYDNKNPGVQFEEDGGHLRRVWVKGSTNQRYDLLDRKLGLPDDWSLNDRASRLRSHQPRATSRPVFGSPNP